MRCQFCTEELSEGSVLCDWCGKRQQKPDSTLSKPSVQENQESCSQPNLISEIIAKVGEYFHWTETRALLEGDTLMLIAFILLGLNAIRALLNLLGLFGTREIALDIFIIAAFLGLIRLSWWALLMMVLPYTLISFIFLRLAVALDAEDLVWKALLQFFLGLFMLLVLLTRRHRFL
jgi:hypothetical protein